ncbi:MAG: GHMP kinase [Chthonomonadales bacterium]|nr:GHMP kinase [Chthonomonadales bacterium]
MDILRASAPGRVCLFGEHQDYLGLPVVAAAVDLRIAVEGAPRDASGFGVDMPDIGQRADLSVDAELPYATRRDYLRSAVNVLRRRGVRWPRGYDVTLRGDIPINAGVSSSSAMVVMWLRFLLAAGGGPEPEPEDLARLAYEAEVTEFGEPGGMMDHFCAALGGLLWIDTVPPFGAVRLSCDLGGVILGNSLEPKATVETLGRARAQVAEGARMLGERYPGFDLARTPLAAVEDELRRLPADPARRLRANLVNRDLCAAGRGALERSDAGEVGRLLTRHHAELRDGLDLSTVKIERMREAALAAGALGAKINGSGGGGCMFALAPGKEEAVAEAIRREGGVPYRVRVDRGAALDP